jgi:RNA polymerase sigma-70 factor, ECF subfamily
MTIPEQHQRALQLADRADAALAHGNLDEAMRQYAAAAELEEAALDLLPRTLQRTTGILGVSTATLYLEAGRFADAIRVTELLIESGGLDPYHRSQLEEIGELAVGVTTATGTDATTYQLGRQFYAPIRTRLQMELASIRSSAEAGADEVGRLFTEYGDYMRAFIRRYVQAPDDADDVISNVFVKFVQDPKKYDPARGSLRAYLAMTARFEALRHFRQRSRFEDLVDTPPDVKFDPTAALDAHITSDELLSHLKPACRDLLRKYYIDGWSANEMAAALSLSLDELRSKIRTCVKQARRVYANLARRP